MYTGYRYPIATKDTFTATYVNDTSHCVFIQVIAPSDQPLMSFEICDSLTCAPSQGIDIHLCRQTNYLVQQQPLGKSLGEQPRRIICIATIRPGNRYSTRDVVNFGRCIPENQLPSWINSFNH